VKVKSDVDFVMGIDTRAVWIDAKVTKDPLWNIKEFVLRNDQHCSKIHQWAKLLSAQRRGNMAGYLLWFTALEKITWVPVIAIEFCLKNGLASIHPESSFCRSQGDDIPINFRGLIIGQGQEGPKRGVGGEVVSSQRIDPVREGI
jgi:hypothetical protein